MNGEMDRLLTIQDVCDITRLGQTTIWRMLKKGQFPQPLRLGSRRILWRPSDLEAFLEEQVAGR